MKKSILCLLSVLLSLGLMGQSLKVATVFADNMVLQQNETVPIWGWANPGEEVVLVPSWGDTLRVRTANSSKWKAEIPTPAGSYTAHNIEIIGADKAHSIFLKNILIGEVWLASGQSNMEWTNQWLRVNDYEQEAGSADFPSIRFFKVYLRATENPQDDLAGEWNICSPDIMQNTSGTAYYFAKHLQEALDCPVGVIVDAWGGTPIEFWYPPEAEVNQPELIKATQGLQAYMWWPASMTGWGYNAMTYPLQDFSIAGMLWYQGESNATDPLTYAKKTSVLVEHRRKQFKKNIPFYYVQIAPYKYGADQESAQIRDQQRLALRIPNTGMVVTSDIGDTLNIHPSNKRELGKRLSNLALKQHYKTIDQLVESPVFESAELYQKYVFVGFQFGDSLHFTEAERGLFEVAEKDGIFQVVKATIVDGKVRLDTRKIANPLWVKFAFSNMATPVLFNKAGLPASCFGPQKIKAAAKVHVVSDLAHEFTFYADHRFDSQYLPEQKAVTNWCNLYNFDFSNTNLLVLLGCDNRIGYLDKDIETIDSFLKTGGGVVVFGSEKSSSQNTLLKHFGAEFSEEATHPLSASEKIAQIDIEGTGGSVLSFDQAKKWEILLSDAKNKALLARKKVGKGTLLVSSRSLSGNHPSARDSINKEIWKPLLIETASGKPINPNKEFKTMGIDDLEYNDDHGTFKLSYNDYLKPSADAMVDVYKRSMPYVEKRMGVPLSPGMASQVTLLATGGGGFSSGTVVALAVWWGGFPDREDGMIEFLTHEAVHSWVLPYAEIWNEPIATYVGNLVMIDMGHEEEALKRIEKTIERASKLDPSMKNYDLHGKLTGEGKELTPSEKNNIHWGKSYWVWEQLRKENPTVVADYFKLKRKYATAENITKYDINNTVALLSMAMGRDLFEWFNTNGITANKTNAEIRPL